MYLVSRVLFRHAGHHGVLVHQRGMGPLLVARVRVRAAMPPATRTDKTQTQVNNVYNEDCLN